MAIPPAGRPSGPSPGPGPGPAAGNGPVLRLSRLLKRPVADRSGESLGRLSDVIVRLRGADYPLVTGLVGAVGGRRVFIPVEQVSSFSRGGPAGEPAGEPLKLTSARLDLRHFDRREGEVLLRADVLGHRLIDVRNARLVRAADLELASDNGEWVVSGVDTRPRRRRWFGLGVESGAGLDPGAGLDSGAGLFRDWHDFEWLIGHAGSALLRGPFARIRRLKPAQIADLLEDASKEEQTEILGRVHVDPELEADVFEELDEDEAARLLAGRSDADIAGVLAKMRADDAADAIAELPQRRRQPVLDLLPAGQRGKVLTLLGFNATSAGGLMGVDFITLPTMATVDQALAKVRESGTLQPEALTSVHAVDNDGCLRGVATLVALLQSAGSAALIDVCDTDPVRVGADTDVMDVAVLMTDYNLITIPVVDDERCLLGVITVDDVLEVTLPDDWRRREAAEPPDARHGDARLAGYAAGAQAGDVGRGVTEAGQHRVGVRAGQRRRQRRAGRGAAEARRGGRLCHAVEVGERLPGLVVRVGGDLVEAEDRRDARVGRRELRRPFGAGALGEDRGEALAQGRPVRRFGAVGQVRIVGQPEALEQLRVERGFQRADGDELAVRGLVRVVERGAAVDQVGAALRPPPAHGREAVENRGQQRRAVHHGGVDHLAAAGPFPLQQRGEDADGQQHPAPAEVAGQIDRRHRPLPGAADQG